MDKASLIASTETPRGRGILQSHVNFELRAYLLAVWPDVIRGPDWTSSRQELVPFASVSFHVRRRPNPAGIRQNHQPYQDSGYRWEQSRIPWRLSSLMSTLAGSSSQCFAPLIKIRSFFPIFELHKGHSGVLTRTGQTENL